MADAVASTVVGKVLDSLFGVIKTEIGYMWNCTQNVEKIKNEVESLKVMKRQVEQQINIATNKGNNLIEGVEEWLEKVEAEISKVDNFVKEEANAKKTCFKIGICGNWGTLHQYGKEATQMTPAVLQLQQRGKTYESGVSVETPALGPLDVYENKDLDGIDTHNLALKAIIAALEDESKQIIGIYGTGGVGKTTLAMEVAAKVKSSMFADVAFITVSHRVDVEKMKKDAENVAKRIMKGHKILIIFDDVWEKLDLQALCIPCGSEHKNYKILLTSRSERVCQMMNAQSKICVNTLPTREAWILFKRVLGKRLKTEADLKPVAKEVAQECGGLPLLILAVGNALKHEGIKSWKLALSRMQKHVPSDIGEQIRKAFIHLQLSYECLKSEEAKACFLLCSMFPEDSHISLEDLVRYAVGLGKFDELDSIKDARDRVQDAVNILTSSCLLLNVEDGKHSTKMHDVVRDVALLIASQSNNKILVKAGKVLTEWLPVDNSLESYTGISLMNNVIPKLPDYKVHLDQLEIFILNGNSKLPMISDEFIKGMKEIKVLDIGNNVYSQSTSPNAPFPQSLKLLTKLRMLNLERNKSFHEISILGEMTALEILILNGTGIKEIPKEIGRLVNLRVLEVNDCEHLSRIALGVIPKLWRLEELCIGLLNVQEGVHNFVGEVMNLSNVTYLDLTVPSIDDIPAQGFNSEKLEGVVIQIRDCPNECNKEDAKEHYRYEPYYYHYPYYYAPSEYPNPYERDMSPAFSPYYYHYPYYYAPSEYPNPYERDMSSASRPARDPFHSKKQLKIPYERDMGSASRSDRYLILSKKQLRIPSSKWIKKLIEGSRPVTILESIENLNNIMPTLYYVGFNKLEHIELSLCPNLSCLVDSTRCDRDQGKRREKFLMELKHLHLRYLQKLEVVWKGPDEYASLTNLVTLEMKNCDKLVRVFSVSVAQGLVNLKYLTVEWCKGVEEVIWGGGDEESNRHGEIADSIEFPSLYSISLFALSNLKSFHSGNSTIRYPSLQLVKVIDCENMKTWGPGIHEAPILGHDLNDPSYMTVSTYSSAACTIQ